MNSSVFCVPQAVRHAVSVPFRMDELFLRDKLQKARLSRSSGHLRATEQHRRALPVTTHADPSVLHAQSARSLEQGSRYMEGHRAPCRAIPLHHTGLCQTFPTPSQTNDSLPPVYLQTRGCRADLPTQNRWRLSSRRAPSTRPPCRHDTHMRPHKALYSQSWPVCACAP